MARAARPAPKRAEKSSVSKEGRSRPVRGAKPAGPRTSAASPVARRPKAAGAPGEAEARGSARPRTTAAKPGVRNPAGAPRTDGAPRPASPASRRPKAAGAPGEGEARSSARPKTTAAKPGARKTAGAPRTAGPRKPTGKPRSGGASHGLERLQKILAHAGVASRRACEAMILEGRVQVNGVTITELGAKADPRRDTVTLDLQPIQKEAPVYILVNKPKGYVTTVKDDEGRPTVMALLSGVEARVYPVGRLDFNSEGLLLMTNDGEMAQRLASPDHHVPKVYLVKVHRTPRPETLDEMREGFRLDGQKLKPCGIEFHDRQDNPWLRVTLIEGKNQQIRKMFAAVGHPVSKLRRIQFGPLDDPYLKPGEWRYLNPQELAALKSL